MKHHELRTSSGSRLNDDQQADDNDDDDGHQMRCRTSTNQCVRHLGLTCFFFFQVRRRRCSRSFWLNSPHLSMKRLLGYLYRVIRRWPGSARQLIGEEVLAVSGQWIQSTSPTRQSAGNPAGAEPGGVPWSVDRPPSTTPSGITWATPDSGCTRRLGDDGVGRRC